jgi:hypothetical protein
MPKINREHTTDAPRPKRRNIRTLNANQMEYLLAGHLETDELQELSDRFGLWKNLLEAMRAAYNAGKRVRKE